MLRTTTHERLEVLKTALKLTQVIGQYKKPDATTPPIIYAMRDDLLENSLGQSTDSPRRSLTEKIFSTIGSPLAGSVFLRALAILASVFLTIVLTRVLSLAEYGIYTYSLSIANILFLPLVGGLPVLVLRESARGMSNKHLVRIRTLLSWASIVVLGVGAVLFILVGVIDWTGLRGALKLPEETGLAILLTLVISLVWVIGASIRGMNRIFMGGLAADVLRPAVFSIAMVSIWRLSNGSLTAASAFTVHIFATFFALGVSVLVIRSMLRFSIAQSRTSKFYTRKWLSALVPLSLSAGITLVMSNTDIVMLGLFGRELEVGPYSVAVRSATWASIGLLVINQAIQPRLVNLYQKKNQARLQHLVSRSSLYAFGAAIVTAAIIALWGKQALTTLFGTAYAVSYVPLLIITFGQVINSFFGPVRSLLELTGHEQIVLRIILVTAVANTLMNAVLIPQLGANGAAISTASALVIWNVSCWVLAKKHCGIDTRAKVRPYPVEPALT